VEEVVLAWEGGSGDVWREAAMMFSRSFTSVTLRVDTHTVWRRVGLASRLC